MERGQIFREFVQDSIELLDEIERQLLELEEHVDRSSAELPEIIGALFRSFHSLKGTSGFFDLALVVRTSHEAESLLDLFRSGSILIATDYIDALMECQEFLADFFRRLAEKPQSLDRPELAEQSRAIGSRLSIMCSEVKELGSATAEAPLAGTQKADLLDLGEPAVSEAEASSAPKFALFDSDDTEPSAGSQPGREITQQKSAAADTGALRPSASKTIRIDTEKLDGLMELVGEFSIGVSLVDDAARRREEHQELFRIRMNQLKKTARHLQELSLSLRMVPLSHVFEKMKRLVRDLQRKTGKPFSLTVKGGDTEVDKTVVELLSEPLVHLLRNAVDHGLESTEERIAAQKAESGRIILEARYSGGEVWILLRDDGKGLDREKILDRARRNGLLEGGGETLTDRQVWSYIFRPGFSTSAQLSDVSGRGVGMDVVEKTINRINGRIEIYTRQGKGTLFILKIPLTLSLLEGMVIRVAEDYFIVPTAEIRESLRYDALSEKSIFSGINFVQLRDELIPVFQLNDMLAYRKQRRVESPRPLLVIMEHEKRAVGLVVDEILGNTTVVVKSVFDILGSISGVSGCTVLGSGRVGLILDVKQLTTKFQRKAETARAEAMEKA